MEFSARPNCCYCSGVLPALFSSSNPTGFEEVLDQIPHVVSLDMNAQLTCEFIAVKVKVALKHMAPLKSPGPNSMTPLFYQSYWSLVGSNVTEAILCFLNSTSIGKGTKKYLTTSQNYSNHHIILISRVML